MSGGRLTVSDAKVLAILIAWEARVVPADQVLRALDVTMRELCDLEFEAIGLGKALAEGREPEPLAESGAGGRMTHWRAWSRAVSDRVSEWASVKLFRRDYPATR